MSLLRAGRRVSDTLVVDRRLGEGAYAEVYRVRHEYLGWQALKLFKRVGSLTETRALLDEARLLSRLGHPNIVRLFDANTVRTDQGVRGYFTMEYVAGGSLERFVAAYRGMVPIDDAVRIVEQVAAGLTVAHEQDPPIVHRDLIPANILIGYDGAGMRVRIGDFGLAKQSDPDSLVTSAAGTYAFVAPEVVRGKEYSRASDVWSLGTVAYLLLTSHLPYADADPATLTRFRRPPLPPSWFNALVDPELDRIVLATLERDPATRPATAAELAARLRARRDALTRLPAPRPPTEPEHAPDEKAPAVPATAGGGGVPDPARLARRALELSRQPSALPRAADLMEQAINQSPRLRERYLPILTAWRRGVMR